MFHFMAQHTRRPEAIGVRLGCARVCVRVRVCARARRALCVRQCLDRGE